MLIDQNDKIRVVTPSTNYRQKEQGIDYRTASLTITADYSNYTGNIVYVKTQNNIPFAVDPNLMTVKSPEEPNPHLEIKITYTIRNNEGIHKTMELIESLQENGKLHGKDAAEILTALNEMYLQDRSRFNKVNFSFVVYKRVLLDDMKQDGSVYIREVDAVISRNKKEMAVPHPNSTFGLHQFDVTRNPNTCNQAGVFVQVVDNDNLARARYYYSGKQLVEVPSIVDKTRESGVYCTVSSAASDGFLTPKTSVMTFDEAEETIGLYRNQEDARTHGDPERQFENELKELRNRDKALSNMNLKLKEDVLRLQNILETSSMVRKTGLEEIKDEQEAKSIKRKNKSEKLKARIDELERERKNHFDEVMTQRKDYYEERGHSRKQYYEDRSYDRKDTSEMIKYIPALLLGVAGTFAWINSRKE